MKKQFAALLAALSLLPTLALAQDYYTLPEIREQAKDGWHETYTDKYGRETVVDIDVEVYGGENAPVLKTKPAWYAVQPEKLDAGAEWRSEHGQIVIWHQNPADFVIQGMEKLESIGEEAFSATALTSFTVSQACSSIPSKAFYDCRCLKDVVILSMNTTIEEDAFSKSEARLSDAELTIHCFSNSLAESFARSQKWKVNLFNQY